MLTHNGFSAWISSDGIPLHEFKTKIDDRNNLITCWIPSEVGKNFAVHWRDNGGLVDTAAYIYIDGFEVPGYFLFGFGEAYRGAARVGPTLQRPFVFADVNERRKPSRRSSKDTRGVIQLAIKRIKRVGTATANVPRVPPTNDNNDSGTSSSSFGSEQPASAQLQSTWQIEPYDPEHPEPCVTFEWRYRSLHYLVKHDLAKLSDLTEPGTVEHESESSPSTPSSSRAAKKRSLMTPSPSPSPPPFHKRFRPSRNPSYGNLEEGATPDGAAFYATWSAVDFCMPTPSSNASSQPQAEASQSKSEPTD